MAGSARKNSLLVAALIVALAVGMAIAYNWDQARRTDAALHRAGTSIKRDVQEFHHDHAEYPRGLRLHEGMLELVGGTAKRTNAVDLGSRVRLAWYSDKPDPRVSTSFQVRTGGYTYCIDADGRHWQLNATEEGLSTRNAKGNCPAEPAP